MLDGFIVAQMIINGVQILNTIVDNDSLNYVISPGTSSLIAMGPDKLVGYDGHFLILATLSNVHGLCTYAWFHSPDGSQWKGIGIGGCLINVLEPGSYYCRVTFEDHEMVSKTVVILQQGDVFLVSQEVVADVADKEKVSPFGSIEIIQRDDFNFSAADEIGRGSFGIVYRGAWVGTRVAIKQICFKRRKRHMDIAMQQELSIHARVRHPNIIQLMAMSFDDSYLYILSELVDGPNLDDVLFDKNLSWKLGASDISGIGRQCAQSVAYLHGLRPMIIHQDIKPANILISFKSCPPLAKLCDFGLGKIKTMHTVASAIVGIQGTPFYMAPECLLESKPGSTSSDVWSLGCTLIELATGKELWNFPDEVVDLFAAVTSNLRQKILPCGLAYLKDIHACPINRDVLVQCLSLQPEGRPTALYVADSFRV